MKQFKQYIAENEHEFIPQDSIDTMVDHVVDMGKHVPITFHAPEIGKRFTFHDINDAIDAIHRSTARHITMGTPEERAIQLHDPLVRSVIRKQADMVNHLFNNNDNFTEHMRKVTNHLLEINPDLNVKTAGGIVLKGVMAGATKRIRDNVTSDFARGMAMNTDFHSTNRTFHNMLVTQYGHRFGPIFASADEEEDIS